MLVAPDKPMSETNAETFYVSTGFCGRLIVRMLARCPTGDRVRGSDEP
jgi:hypothetical protein